MNTNSARIFGCAKCCKQVILCSACDRGNIYCLNCAFIAREISLQKAGKRYQNTWRGRKNHAARQKRYRQRLLLTNNSPLAENDSLLPQDNTPMVLKHYSLYYFIGLKNVTHHGSPPATHHDVLSHGPNESVEGTKDLKSVGIYCQDCGQSCDPYLRSGFMRRYLGSRASSSLAWPGGP